MDTSSQTAPWRDPEIFPEHDRDGWSLWRAGKVSSETFESIAELPDKLLSGSHRLIGKPGAKHFLPAVCIAEFAGRVQKQTFRHIRTLATISLVTAAIFLLLGLWDPDAIPLGLMFALLTLVFMLDFVRYLREPNVLVDRVLFVYWAQSNRVGLVVWVLVAAGIGVFQLLVQHAVGGTTNAFHAIGVMFPDVRRGEWWRLLISPLLHYSLAHFFINAILLVIAGWITWPVFGCYTFLVFVGGSAAGALGQMYLGATQFDNFGGISAGVYAMLSLFAGASILDKRVCARGIGFVLVIVALNAIFYSEAASKHAATTGHLTGVSMGLLLGLLWACVHRLLR